MSYEPTQFRDRESGTLRNERVFKVDALHAFYQHRNFGGLIGTLAARSPLSALYGALMRTEWSRKRIAPFVSDLGIDASEAERPIDHYRSLDAFFARRLRPGARTWATDPRHFPTPAEGRVLVYPQVERSNLQVKGFALRVRDLVSPGDAIRYGGGSAVVIRLAPVDYHRFHFPVDGEAGNPRRLGGPLHSVHPIALQSGVASFRNKRVTTILESEVFGRLMMVEVGAMLVGRIEQTFTPGYVRRGDEKGTFRFGGSTVVVLIEPGKVAFDPDLIEWSARGTETFVRLGSRVGVAP